MPSFRDIVFAVSSVSDVAEALPLTVWLFFAKKKQPYLLLGIFISILFLLKIVTLITAVQHINNMPLFHLLALIEITAIFIFYCQLLFKRIKWWGVFILIVFHVLNAFFIQNIWTFNSLSWTVDMIIIIGIGLQYFYHIYNDESDYIPLQHRPDFVITIGWLIYAAGSLFTYLMGTTILTGYAEGFLKNGWVFQTVSNISKDIIISYGFWLTNKR
ncbi:hypothetical protein HDF24_18935 [Mucilaginibacter sp. X4EP1]|jgi:hypothetical protein|uniref:hypothetical protein n=1 Tax=Mucilaginibacter sp. X4EP1 TaxID=2723092 RepID=UPI00216A703A|nr:hypothetical protein [Mucilaginibacter sp. X4EP1]MCS3813351.1 hypothetical protein [Mucilaginibacter sp. X4EP1]